jgi:hypothetical protein
MVIILELKLNKPTLLDPAMMLLRTKLTGIERFMSAPKTHDARSFGQAAADRNLIVRTMLLTLMEPKTRSISPPTAVLLTLKAEQTIARRVNNSAGPDRDLLSVAPAHFDRVHRRTCRQEWRGRTGREFEDYVVGPSAHLRPSLLRTVGRSSCTPAASPP